jgi:KTSC domain
VYIYYAVPQQVVDAFMSAPSKGSFYNRDIRNVYRFSKQ